MFTSTVIYEDKDLFASHPANHGRWQFSDQEWLFGFLTGKKGQGEYHDIVPPYTKVLMRTKDAGQNWDLEIPNLDFECTSYVSEKPAIDSNTIFRVCGEYDTGGEFCRLEGGYYTSQDKGHTWQGAFKFDGLQDIFTPPYQNTSRTCQLDNILFLSARKIKSWGSDFVFCASFDENEGRFRVKSIVCSDEDRAVMPSVCKTRDGLVICAMRRKFSGRNGIEVFLSRDNCESWSSVHEIATGQSNGNPPAIAYLDGMISLFHCNRSRGTMNISTSYDGVEWKDFVICKVEGNDIGYPVVFERKLGLVCIIYVDGKILEYKWRQ